MRKGFEGSIRVFLQLVACTLLLGYTCAYAQTYPSRPVRLILPFPPGGPTDIVARTFSAKLGEALGQQVVPDNRGGAGGAIGADLAARAVPDGYTLFQGAVGVMTINPSLYQKLPYDPIKDFRPVSLLTASPYVLLISSTLPAKSVKELLALAKSRPGKLNFASGGVGTGNHLSGELFKLTGGLDIVDGILEGDVIESVRIRRR